MLQDGMYMSDDEFLSNFRMDRWCSCNWTVWLKMMKPSRVFI